MSFRDNLIIELLRIIPFFIVGLITAYIAYRQYKIEKSNLDKGLYQIRLKVFKIIDKIQFILVKDKKVDNEMLHKVSFDIEERHFVFSIDLNKKIDEFTNAIWEARELELNSKLDESFELVDKIINDANEVKEFIIKETKIKK